MKATTKEALELFVEKTNKLKSLSFTTEAQKAKLKVSWHNATGIMRSELTGPNVEQVDAFILTFRFFIQENEPCSFRWLAKNVLDDPGVSDHWKQEFSKARAGYNQYLDEYPSFPAIIEGEPLLTRREIMEMFVYGDLSHVNKKKRQELKKRISAFVVSQMYGLEFFQILNISLNHFFAFVTVLSEAELMNTHDG